MKSIVTGACGFIGSNLIEHLVDKGESVLGIDKNFDRRHYFKKYINSPVYYLDINKLKDNFYMVWSDVGKLSCFPQSFENVDTIYHLAAASDIKRSLEDPTWDLIENVNKTHSILEFMRRHDINKIIFTSTSVVHGLNAPQPTPEWGVDLKPISQYAASKIACEVFINAYSNVYGIKGWIFRLGNVIGKNQHRGVIFDFINKLKENPKRLDILGDGNQIKSYVHVSDVINAITQIPKIDKNKSVEVYNISTYDQMNVIDLADIVCDELKVKPDYYFTGKDHGWVGDVPQVVLSIEKALSTGWKPKMKCEEAIRRTVKELVG